MSIANDRNQAKEYEDRYRLSEKGKAVRRAYRDLYYKTVKGRINQMFGAAKKRAFEKGLEFSITKDDIVIPERCPLLDLKLSCEGFGNRYNSPSLDRKDSSKGYTRGNIWVISSRANLLKNNAEVSELELLVRNLKKCGFS